MKGKKGVAGLEFYLSVIVFLFIIGIIVMSITLMGGQLRESIGYSTIGPNTTLGELLFVDNSTGNVTSVVSLRSVACSFTAVANASNNLSIGSGNYTVSNCNITAVAGSEFQSLDWHVNYTFTYEDANEAFDVINGTTDAISDNASSNFGLYMTIAGIIVLILMVVLIVRAVRGGGLMSGGGSRDLGGA